MTRINSGQLFALLLLSSVWQILCTPVQPQGIFWAIPVGLVQGLLCIPMLRAAALHPPESVLRQHPVLCYGMAFYCILWGARTMAQAAGAAPPRVTRDIPPALAALLLLVTVMHTARRGLHVTARSAVLLLIPAALSVILLCVGAWKRMDCPTFRADPESGLRSFFSAGELAAVWLLAGQVRTGRGRAVAGWLLARALLCMLLTAVCITAGGRLTAQARYPYVMLAALSQPMQGQRADALYLLAAVMLLVLQLTFLTGLCSRTLRLRHPEWHFVPAAAPAVMLLLAWQVPAGMLDALASGMLLPAAVLVPLYTGIFRNKEAVA